MPCNISYGTTKNKQVRCLQLFLHANKPYLHRKAHYYDRKIDGYYGKYLKDAVRTYQKIHNKNCNAKLKVDGWAGPKTTLHMEKHGFQCNCTTPTPPAPHVPITPAEPYLPPSSSVPSRILPDHTVSIGNIGFYAESPEIVEPFQRINYDKVEIEGGLSRYYPTNTHNREMNFKVTLLKKLPATPYLNSEGKSDFQEMLKLVQECQGIRKFTSIHIGSFNALITVKLNDFKPGTAVATFNVQEIGE